MARAGDTVVVVLDADSRTKTVRSLGKGTYDGDVEIAMVPGIRNPRITLAGGGQVWGYECWWGSEERMLAKFPKPQWTWVEVDFNRYRLGRHA